MENKELELKAKLIKKILAVQKNVGQLKPDGKNTKQGYRFVSANKLETKLNEYLVQENLAIIPETISNEIRTGSYKTGSSYSKAIVEIQFEIIDGETGYGIKKKFTGSDIDTAGKEIAQAITESCKRFYFKLFHIAEGLEDSDSKTAPEIKVGQNEVEKIIGKPYQIKSLKDVGLPEKIITRIIELADGDDTNIKLVIELQKSGKNIIEFFKNIYPQTGFDKTKIENYYGSESFQMGENN